MAVLTLAAGSSPGAAGGCRRDPAALRSLDELREPAGISTEKSASRQQSTEHY